MYTLTYSQTHSVLNVTREKILLYTFTTKILDFQCKAMPIPSFIRDAHSGKMKYIPVKI